MWTARTDLSLNSKILESIIYSNCLLQVNPFHPLYIHGQICHHCLTKLPCSIVNCNQSKFVSSMGKNRGREPSRLHAVSQHEYSIFWRQQCSSQDKLLLCTCQWIENFWVSAHLSCLSIPHNIFYCFLSTIALIS